MNNICGETHINRTGLHLFQLCRHNSQVFRIVYLSAKKITNVECMNPDCTVQLIQSIFCIYFCIPRFTESHNLVQPYLPIIFLQMIKSLRRHRVIEKIDTNLLYHVISNHSLEILFRQRQRGRHGHA